MPVRVVQYKQYKIQIVERLEYDVILWPRNILYVFVVYSDVLRMRMAVEPKFREVHNRFSAKHKT